MKTSHILLIGAGIVGVIFLWMKLRGGGSVAPTMPPNKAIQPAPALPALALSDPATGKGLAFTRIIGPLGNPVMYGGMRS